MIRSSKQEKINTTELVYTTSDRFEIVSNNHSYSMMKWSGFSIVLFTYLFFAPILSHAQVMMTEVMYDLEGTDTGREWIEVYNAGASGVDIADWKLYEANTNHRLTAQNASVIPAQSFAVIADNVDKFLTDNPSFSGLLFDSTFSLSNEGELLILRDGSASDIDTFSYTSALGANGDGKSLQKSGSSWVSALPTLGVMVDSGTTQTPSPSDTNSNNSSSQVSGGSSSSYSSQAITNGLSDDVTLEVSSGRDRLGFVGAPLSFEAKVKKPKDVPAIYVGHRWSMGDGSQKTGQFISHTYVYPGDYVVILNSEYGGESAVSKIKVRIVSPKVSIRDVNRDFIELVNESSDELNLGGWSIETHDGRFVIPPDTIILSRGSVRLPNSATRLQPIGFVRLVNPSMSVIASRDVYGTSSNIGTNTNGEVEVVVALEGVTEEMIRNQFALALNNVRTENSIKPVRVVVNKPDIVNEGKEKPPSTTTNAQMASVIYTVGENDRSRSLIRRLIDFFTR